MFCCTLVRLILPTSFRVTSLATLKNLGKYITWFHKAWWRHKMEIFSALLAIWAGNSPVPGEFHAQRSVMRSFDVFFDLRLNKWLSKQRWGWWFEMSLRPLWRHRNRNHKKIQHDITMFIFCGMYWKHYSDLPWWIFMEVNGQLISLWKKWPPFRRQYFQMHFYEWKMYFDYNFTEVCSEGSNWQ